MQSALADVFPRELLAYAAKMNDVESWTFGARRGSKVGGR